MFGGCRKTGPLRTFIFRTKKSTFGSQVRQKGDSWLHLAPKWGPLASNSNARSFTHVFFVCVSSSFEDELPHAWVNALSSAQAVVGMHYSFGSCALMWRELPTGPTQPPWLRPGNLYNMYTVGRVHWDFSPAGIFPSNLIVLSRWVSRART